jgi:fatty acid desaturase
MRQVPEVPAAPAAHPVKAAVAVAAAGAILLAALGVNAGLLAVVLIAAGVPVALFVAAAVARLTWLTWRARNDNLPLRPPPRLRLPEARSPVRIIRGELLPHRERTP